MNKNRDSNPGSDSHAHKQLSDRANRNMRERASGTQIVISSGFINPREDNIKLTGREKYRTYANILVNCTTVSASLNWFLALVGRAKWSVAPAEADSTGEVAMMMEEMLFDDPMTSWAEINRRASMARFFGFSLQEIVLRPRDDGMLTIDDIYSIPQPTVYRWLMEKGKFEGIEQMDGNGQRAEIARQKMIYVSDQAVSDSPEGLGVARLIVNDATRLIAIEKLEENAYRADIGGMPIAKAPLANLEAEFPDDEDGNAALEEKLSPLKDAIAKTKRGETGFGLLLDSAVHTYQDAQGGEKLVNVPQYSFELLKGEAKGFAELRELKTTYKKDIARAMGTESLLLGEESTGSFALSSNKDHQFALVVEGQLEDNRRALQRDLLDPLARLNGITDDMIPMLQVERAENQDPKMQIDAFREMAKAGLIHPSDIEAINYFRETFGFPPMSMEVAEMLAMEPMMPQNDPTTDPVDDPTTDDMEN